ncbi:MAG: hypothetical protein ACON4R_11645 [Akkermansiaceae bacterium]
MPGDPFKPLELPKCGLMFGRTTWHRILRWLGPLFVVLTVVAMVYKVVLMGIIDTLPLDQMAKHVTIVI